MTKGDNDMHAGTVVMLAKNHILVKNKYSVWEIKATGIGSNLTHFAGKNVKATIEEE
jgi:hypothetical protein